MKKGEKGLSPRRPMILRGQKLFDSFFPCGEGVLRATSVPKSKAVFSKCFRQADRLEDRCPGDLHGTTCVLGSGLKIRPRNDFSDFDPQIAAKDSILLNFQLKPAVHPDKCFFMALSVGELPTDHLQDEKSFNVTCHVGQEDFGPGDRGIKLSL